MAWNQFPMNQNYNFQQSVSPMQTQNVMQNTFMPIQVRDEAEAKSYPMAANTTISMVDAAMTHFWVKSTNASGTVVLFDTYNLSKVVEAKPEYVTKADFDAKFEAFEKRLFESLGGK